MALNLKTAADGLKMPYGWEYEAVDGQRTGYVWTGSGVCICGDRVTLRGRCPGCGRVWTRYRFPETAVEAAIKAGL
jgi:hypothetical protein